MAKDIDLLTLLARYSRANGLRLTELATADRFAADALQRLRIATGDQRLIFGIRTERMFEAMILSLGRFRLLKSEDNGVVHSAEEFRAPDFRIVTHDGEQWLIEVKNVHRDDPLEQVSEMDPAYFASLRGYSNAVRSPLLVAHFWSRWGMWTLVEPTRFMTKQGGLRIEMAEALPYSRLSDFGDVSINLPGPLRLTGVKKDAEDLTDAAQTRPEISIYAAGQLLTDIRDQKLATILMAYGDWPLEGPFEETREDGATLVHLQAAPPEKSDEGFDGIGLASRIYSRFYRAETSAGDQVSQLHGTPRPEWFKPLSEWDFRTSKLGLRLFHIRAQEGQGRREHGN